MLIHFRSCLVAAAVALCAAGSQGQIVTSPTRPTPAPDERADIERLYHAGDTAQALKRLDADIEADPRAAPLRFLKAVILSETGHPADASELYLRLTQDYPELPEPYNNLAVLYAADGQLDKAREALETALRNDPDYATAHENLGDVYVRLAIRSYVASGAHNVETARNPQLVRKLALARQLLARPGAGS